VGNTRPVQTKQGSNSTLNINNKAFTGGVLGGLSDRLNLVLNAAPSTIGGNYQNLGLFSETKITGNGTYPTVFYSLDGLTQLSAGTTITATYASIVYSWTISYSGLITFTDTSTSSYTPTNVAATGGADVVLIGLTAPPPVPEPGSLALLGGAGSLILARRRGKKA